jgi:GNAT superfamily N-acetyltransferase
VETHNWNVVPYTPDLLPEVVALVHRTLGDVELADPAFLRWQYNDNPAGTAISALLRAPVGGPVVSQYASLPLRMSIDGEPKLACISINLLTDPAHRGKGVLVHAGEAAHELMVRAGAACIFGFPNANSFHAVVKYLGYRLVGDIPFLVRPVNLPRLLARALPRLGAWRLLEKLPSLSRAPASPAPLAGLRIEAIDCFDEYFDEFWKRVAHRHRVWIVRDARRLNWRFRAIPTRHYHCLRATSGQEQIGYVVLRSAQLQGLRTGLVVDFVVEESARGTRAGHSLLSHALAWFDDDRPDLIGALMVPHALEHRLLRRAGFWPVPTRFLPQRVVLVAQGDPVVQSLRHWFYTLGDYDVA